MLGSTPNETAIIDSLSYTQDFADLNSLKSAISEVTTQLIDLGYIDTRLASLEENDSLYIGIMELQDQYKYINLHVPTNSQLRNFIKQTGTNVKKDSIKIETAFAKAFLEKLTNIASNSGNPFATFQLSNITKAENKSLTAQLLFTSQSTRTVDQIILKGYEKFPETFLKRYANIKTGVLFNQEKLLDQNNKLNALSFAKSTKEPEVLFRQDSTTVYFYLEQTTSNRFDGFLGFATDETTNNLRLDGYIDLQLNNNLNYGETLLLNYKSDGQDQSQLNASITLPYLFKSPLGLEAKLALFRKDSTFSTTSQEATLFYKLSPRITAGIGYIAARSENLQDATAESNTTLDYTSNKFLISGGYVQTQDDYFFPTKATFSINGSLGNRRTDQIERQIGLQLDASVIITLNKKNLLFVRNTTQSLWSDDFVTNELYRFGGITSIRGFEENSIFANFLTTLNTEYRYVFNQSLYVHSVIDLGYFENRINTQTLGLFSIGVGSGIRTKAGVLKIIIANGKNEKQNFDFNNTKLHFQLAIRF